MLYKHKFIIFRTLSCSKYYLICKYGEIGVQHNQNTKIMEKVVVEFLIEPLCPRTRRNFPPKIHLRNRFYLSLPTNFTVKEVCECKMHARLKAECVVSGVWGSVEGAPHNQWYSLKQPGDKEQTITGLKLKVMCMNSDVPFTFQPRITSSSLFCFIRF